MTNTTTHPIDMDCAAKRALSLIGREARRLQSRGLGAARAFKRAARSAPLSDSDWAILLLYLLELESQRGMPPESPNTLINERPGASPRLLTLVYEECPYPWLRDLLIGVLPGLAFGLVFGLIVYWLTPLYR